MGTTIVDISRAFPGTHLAALREVLSQESPEHLVILTTDSQLEDVKSAWPHAVVNSIGESHVARIVMEAIGGLRPITPTPHVVYSFSGAVLAMAALAPEDETISLRPIRPRATSDIPPKPWPDSHVPRDDALDALVTVLRHARSAKESLNRANLRPLLEALDRRFVKTGSAEDPIPNLVSRLIALGEDAGVVQS